MEDARRYELNLGIGNDGAKYTVELELRRKKSASGLTVHLEPCDEVTEVSLTYRATFGRRDEAGDHGGAGVPSLPDYFPGSRRVRRLAELADRWHLNAMRAGCAHVACADVREVVEVVSYGLTTEAYHRRKKLQEEVSAAVARGEVPALDETDRALLVPEDWYRDRFEPPDADSPLSGCYEVKKRWTKARGWVRPEEHPRGLLDRPCATCGYAYGTAWLAEPLPSGVEAELLALFEARE